MLNGHKKALVVLCMLSALLVSAFAAQSASALSRGTTAFTCKDTGGPTGTFTKAHCKSSDQGLGNFSHVAFPQDLTTEVELTSNKTNAETNNCTNSTLKATVAGIVLELSTCVVHGGGWMENKVDPDGEHYIVGHGTLTYTNVQVTKPAGKGCKVYTDVTPGGLKGEEGVVHSEPLRLTSTGQGDSVRIQPTVGNVLGSFIIDGCVGVPLNKTYSVEGFLNCIPNGATINCSHLETTAQGTLFLNGGIKAGYEGSLTPSGRLPGGQPFTPLSPTTVETT